MPIRPTDAQLREWRTIAEKATPGPWQRSGVRQKLGVEDCIMVGPDRFLIVALPIGKNPGEHAGAFLYAGYIAAFDPTTAIAIIDELLSRRASINCS